MNKTLETTISKKLSYVLRHEPESIGIVLNSQGWTSVEILLEKMKITFSELQFVVRNNAKQRFAISPNNKMIRANQGHSLLIDLNLETKRPPEVLYHGTSMKNRGIINKEGIKKMKRTHVHLSIDIETAKKVGARHGKPFVFLVDSNSMEEDGYLFFQADNGVWLTEIVPIKYLLLSDL